MEVVDLRPEQPDLEEAFLTCLEPWNPDAVEGRAAKAAWYAAMKDRGLFVKLALEDGVPVGFVQCVPIEESPMLGSGLYAILCIWVHGHPRGVGNHQGHGLGTALLVAAEREAQHRGALGMAAWGLALPVWMRASWFRRHGYATVDRQDGLVLLLKRFSARARAPAWPPHGPPPPGVDGRTTVTCFSNGWCMAANATCTRARRVAEGFGDKVAFRQIATLDPAVARQWGHSDALFIDQDEVRTGPPPSERKLRRLVRRRVEGGWWRRWTRRIAGIGGSTKQG